MLKIFTFLCLAATTCYSLRLTNFNHQCPGEFIYLFIYLFIHLLIFLFVCLFIYLFIYLSIWFKHILFQPFIRIHMHLLQSSK